MKARIPLSKKQRKFLEQESERYITQIVEKEIDREREALVRRLFKTMIAALHNEFGFGHDRALKAFNAFNEVISHSDTDEVYWEKVDRLVIDYLKIPFEKRDYTDNGKAVEYD